MDRLTSRRAVLRASAATTTPLLSGCSGIVQSVVGPPPDVVVFNKTDNARTVKITIVDQPTGKTVLSKTQTISAGEAAEYPDVLASSGTYTITIKTDSGLTNSYQWSVSSDDQSIYVMINADSITFREVSP